MIGKTRAKVYKMEFYKLVDKIHKISEDMHKIFRRYILCLTIWMLHQGEDFCCYLLFLLQLVIVIAASVSFFLLKFIYLMVRHGGKFGSLESLD